MSVYSVDVWPIDHDGPSMSMMVVGTTASDAEDNARMLYLEDHPFQNWDYLAAKATVGPDVDPQEEE